MKRNITLVFSGRRGGGLTDLKNIIRGYISRNNYNIKIISLRHFESIEKLINGTDIEYASISKNCDSIPKEIFANLQYVIFLCKEVFVSKNILFSMIHPNLVFFPLFRLLAIFSGSNLLYIRHNPRAFRHVSGYIHNKLTVISDEVATLFCSRLLFFSRHVMGCFSNSYYSKKSHYIGFGVNKFSECLSPNTNDTICFIFFGRALPYKGLGFLISSLNKINSLSFQVIFASNMIPMSQLEEIKKLNSNIEVELYNEWLSDEILDNLFKKSSCSILPYKAISQSGPILTSIGYKVPVIASNISGVREYLTDNHDSLLFNPGDHDSLIDKITSFVSSKELRDKLSAGIVSTHDKFSWDNVTINIDKVMNND
jgi:glycosyltransferase involved in cell wall biosynthesis